MIEKIVLDYLNGKLKVPAYMEEKGNMPEEYVLIEKTGGGGNSCIRNATLAIQSFSASKFKAANLNEKVVEEMENIIELDDISKCALNSSYDYTDTAKKRYRYQAIFDIVHY